MISAKYLVAYFVFEFVHLFDLFFAAVAVKICWGSSMVLIVLEVDYKNVIKSQFPYRNPKRSVIVAIKGRLFFLII